MEVYEIIKPLRKRIRDKERLWVFRARLMRLYEEFEAKLEALCQQHGVEINFWYSPSRIPQPKFVFGKVAVDADTLYNEEEFSLLFTPKVDRDKRQYSVKRPKRKNGTHPRIHEKGTHRL